MIRNIPIKNEEAWHRNLRARVQIVRKQICSYSGQDEIAGYTVLITKGIRTRSGIVLKAGQEIDVPVEGLLVDGEAKRKMMKESIRVRTASQP